MKKIYLIILCSFLFGISSYAQPCVTPTTQPTNLRLTDFFGDGSIGGYFDANGPVTGYLVIVSIGAFTGTPVDGTNYSQNQTIGNGKVVQSTFILGFTATNLNGNTQYTITVFSYNSGSCTGGPLYNTTSPPSVSGRSCTILPTPSAINITTTSATISWNSSLGGGVLAITYTIDVATNNTFTAPIPGSPFTVNDPTVSINISGLTEATTYFFRVKATGSCQSSTTYNFITSCSATATPYVQDFDAAIIPALPACTSIEDINGSTTWKTATAPQGFTGKVLRYTNSPVLLPANDWFYSQGINLTAGASYTLGYKYGNDSASFFDYGTNESMNIKYGTAPNSTSMVNTLANHLFIGSTRPYRNAVSFVPSSTAVYYFGFHAYSQSGNYFLYLDSISVRPTGVLPVTLISFNAKRNGAENNIMWSTSQEVNTSHFVIEHSTDGRNFTSIGQVTATGNNSTTRNYQFTDISPVKAINYYKLRIVDRDNGIKFSDVKRVKNSGNTDFIIYPNPAKDVIQIDINSDKADKGEMIITDNNGKQVYSRPVNLTTGNNIFSVDIRKMAKGSYIIKVQLSNEIVVNKITKM